jgi:hypothetical protein
MNRTFYSSVSKPMNIIQIYLSVPMNMKKPANEYRFPVVERFGCI